MNCPFCKGRNLKVHQRNGHAFSTMYRCVSCNRFFSERRFNPNIALGTVFEKTRTAHLIPVNHACFDRLSNFLAALLV